MELRFAAIAFSLLIPLPALRAEDQAGPPKVADLGKDPEVYFKKAARIVIGSPEGTFDPRKEGTASTSDQAIIRSVINATVGMKPVSIDHYWLLPHLPVVLMDEEGTILAAYSFDRTPVADQTGTHAVLRKATVEIRGDKIRVVPESVFLGYYCKALEPFGMKRLEYPPVRPLPKGKDLAPPTHP